MRIKTSRGPELPSTVVVKSLGSGRRKYWTGSEWTKDFFRAKQYLRKEARTKAARKSGRVFVITIGFRGR